MATSFYTFTVGSKVIVHNARFYKDYPIGIITADLMNFDIVFQVLLENGASDAFSCYEMIPYSKLMYWILNGKK